MKLLPLALGDAMPGPTGVLHSHAHGRCLLRSWGRDSITDEVCASVAGNRDHLMYLSQRYVERLERTGRVEVRAQ